MSNLVATPQELAMVAQVLDAYCIAFAVEDANERERTGRLLLRLLEGGRSTVEDLSGALEEHIAKGFLR
jgi:hypothetical protein